ncbi:MAG: dihydrolipoyl dehydrogenase family protein, partial [Vulcanimicrobiaceae bacterium]
ARTARALGARVAFTDPGPLGGLCILRGCMPSKTVIASSDRAQAVREAARLGIASSPPRADLPFIHARKQRIIGGFAAHRVDELQTFDIFQGAAHFESPRRLRVGEQVLEAPAFVVATGSVTAPAVLPGLAQTGYLDSDAVLELDALPESVIVLGGGYVACELGQYLHRLGARTTMLMRAPHVLSGEDDDVGDALTAALRADGLDVRTGIRFERAERGKGGKAVVYVRNGALERLEADELFFALGRVPNVAGLALEAAGVRYHAMTGIEVGPDLRSSQPAIFAVGDVTGEFPLVHVAIYQGAIAARNAILGTSERADYTLQQSHAVFTDPQVAIAGATEKQLARDGIDYRAASYPFSEHGKAIAIDRTAGFVKLLASPADGRILGAAVVGAEGSDLIHEAIVAINYRATVGEFAKIPHLHPTLAEIWTYPAEELAERLGESAAPAAAAM